MTLCHPVPVFVDWFKVHATPRPPRVRSRVALLGALLGVFALPTQSAAQGAPPHVDGKMTAPVEISWIAPSGPQAGQSFQAAFEVSAPLEDLRDVVVTVTPGSGIDLTRPLRFLIGDLTRGESRRVNVPLSARTPGEAEVKAQATATAARGPIRRMDVLYSVVGETETVATRGSFVVARQNRLRHEARTQRMSPEAYEAALRALSQSTGEAEVILGSKSDGAVRRNGSAPVTISGTVRYQDRVGTLQPVRLMPVQLFNNNDDQLLGTVVTGTDGSYSLTVETSGPTDLYIKALASSEGFYIVPPGATEGDIRGVADTYSVKSPVQNGVTTDLTINLDIPNTTVPGNAFSVADALVESSQYVNTVNGGFLPLLPVVFGGEGSFFNGTALFILLLDRYDWDVMHHEYGHYVMEQIGIQDNPGGDHSGGTNLAELHGKSGGLRLAWGEGWPTYFGTSLQQVRNNAAFGIPTVGDVLYTDTEDGELEYSLEAITGGIGLGEDDELSVQRILWDLYDAAPDMRDNVALGDQAIWNTLKGAGPVTLSAAWNALINGRTTQEKVAFGAIFADHKVASDPTAPAEGTEIAMSASPPTFTWDANGAGPSFRLNQFNVEFYSEDLSTLLYTSPQVGTPSYTPTASELSTNIFGSTNRVKWVVRGSNTSDPVTGAYLSPASLLTKEEAAALACATTTPLSFDFDGDADGTAPGGGLAAADDFNVLGTNGTFGEFAGVRNSGGEAVNLSGCSFAAFDAMSEKVTYANAVQGTLAANGTFVLATQNGNQMLPAGSLPDGPGAFVLITGSANVGDTVGDVTGRVVAAVVYDADATVFATVKGGATATQLDAFYNAMSQGFGTDVGESGGLADLAVTVAPNPVVELSTVEFGLAEPADVRVTLHDALGREVAMLASGSFPVGRHQATIEAGPLPAGVYVVRIVGGTEVATARFTVVR